MPGRVAAGLLLALGFLPIVNWIPGGRTAPWFATVASGWLSGSLIAIGGGIVLAILTRRWSPGSTGFPKFAERCLSAPRHTGGVLALAAFVIYAVVAHAAFSGVPLHLDELAQVIQARIFASGRLFLDAGTYPEFRSALHLLDEGGRSYSQFPPGGPLLLVPGVWLGMTWIVGPLAGAASVALFWGIVRRSEANAVVALSAAILFALTPMVVFMSASHMNHAGAMLFALLATWLLCRIDESRWFALLAGLALGFLATIRPVDALAFALPAGAWLGWRFVGDRSRWNELLASGVGVAVPLAALVWYNTQTTGSATLFAYEALWGPAHGLGFHSAPWGEAHTPARGLELLSLYFLRLQTYLFETPTPSIIAALFGLWMWRRWSDIALYWLVSGSLLIGLYFAYWHDGFYLGPRFIYLLVPLLVLLSIHGVRLLGSRLPASSMGGRAFWGTVATAVTMAVFVNAPARFAQYRSGLALMRQDPTAPAREAGVRGALILVRESWGAQLVPRLWALGVSRPLTEALYRLTDTCVLDTQVTVLERAGTRGDDAMRALLPVMRDSARVARSQRSPDESERVLAGHAYSALCERRLLEDRAGFTIFLPLLARSWGENVYARDLHARDSVLVRQHPGRPVYLLRTDAAGTRLVLEPVAMDSLRAEWAAQ
ncbi:MAG: hypothetical protein H7066_18735 [Cytophagaceae bacterium]|nr:hypothetical protein [Gemmatimonadaceae bacterium]